MFVYCLFSVQVYGTRSDRPADGSDYPILGVSRVQKRMGSIFGGKFSC